MEERKDALHRDDVTPIPSNELQVAGNRSDPDSSEKLVPDIAFSPIAGLNLSIQQGL
jgi:hypothetical protein